MPFATTLAESISSYGQQAATEMLFGGLHACLTWGKLVCCRQCTICLSILLYAEVTSVLTECWCAVEHVNGDEKPEFHLGFVVL